MACPACSSTQIGRKQITGRSGALYNVTSCRTCDAIFSDGIYYGNFLDLIDMRWADPEPPASETRYFDFMTIGSKGVQRIHGWYHEATRRVVQIG